MPCLRTAAVSSPTMSREACWRSIGRVGLGMELGQSVKPSWCLVVRTTYLAPAARKISAQVSGFHFLNSRVKGGSEIVVVVIGPVRFAMIFLRWRAVNSHGVEIHRCLDLRTKSGNWRSSLMQLFRPYANKMLQRPCLYASEFALPGGSLLYRWPC